MRQSKFESTVEATANIASGFVISLLMWMFVVRPLYDAELLRSAFWITTIFTITSWLRSYVWRRFFNADLHRAVHKLTKRYINGTSN